MMLLVGIAAILFCLMPSEVIGLNTTEAKCLTGYDWVRSAFHFLNKGCCHFFVQMFSSNGQSPCDVAAELAGVCTDARGFPHAFRGIRTDQQSSV
jgi:hypothetical protein